MCWVHVCVMCLWCAIDPALAGWPMAAIADEENARHDPRPMKMQPVYAFLMRWKGRKRRRALSRPRESTGGCRNFSSILVFFLVICSPSLWSISNSFFNARNREGEVAVTLPAFFINSDFVRHRSCPSRATQRNAHGEFSRRHTIILPSRLQLTTFSGILSTPRNALGRPSVRQVYRRTETLVVSHTSCITGANGDRRKWAIAVGDAADGARCGYIESMAVKFPETELSDSFITG